MRRCCITGALGVERRRGRQTQEAGALGPHAALLCFQNILLSQRLSPSPVEGSPAAAQVSWGPNAQDKPPRIRARKLVLHISPCTARPPVVVRLAVRPSTLEDGGQMGQAWADEAPAPSPQVSHCPLVPCACVASRARLLFIKADLSPSRSCGSVLCPPPSLVHDGLSVCPAVLAHTHTAAHLFLITLKHEMDGQPGRTSCQGQGRPQRTPEEAGSQDGSPRPPSHPHQAPQALGFRALSLSGFSSWCHVSIAAAK